METTAFHFAGSPPADSDAAETAEAVDVVETAAAPVATVETTPAGNVGDATVPDDEDVHSGHLIRLEESNETSSTNVRMSSTVGSDDPPSDSSNH